MRERCRRRTSQDGAVAIELTAVTWARQNRRCPRAARCNLASLVRARRGFGIDPTRVTSDEHGLPGHLAERSFRQRADVTRAHIAKGSGTARRGRSASWTESASRGRSTSSKHAAPRKINVAHHQVLSARRAIASDALQTGQVHAAQPRARADCCTRTRATVVAVAALWNVVTMRRRTTALGKLCTDELARARAAVLDARAFGGRHAPPLPARAVDERHLPRRTRGRHRLTENLRRVAFEPHHASTGNAGRLRSCKPERRALVLLANRVTRSWGFAIRNRLTLATVREDLAVLVGRALGLEAPVDRSARSPTRTDAGVGNRAAARSRGSDRASRAATRPARYRAARRSRASHSRARAATRAAARIGRGRHSAAARDGDREKHQDQAQSKSPLRRVYHSTPPTNARPFARRDSRR